jgi:large subunit ribosomal protein L17
MRHGKTVNHLGRTSSHRKALLSNLSASLILHKRITTTLAKAKALRKHIEPIITKSKLDTTHSRRTVFSYLMDKEATAILFRDIAPKVAERPGGYTRIIKLANRLGDNAEMAIIELVDFNELMLAEKGAKKAKTTRRGRTSKKKDASAAANPADETPKASEGEASSEEKAAE